MPLYDAVRAPRPRKRDRKLHKLIAIGLILVLAAFIPILFRLTLNKAEKCFFSAEYVANLNNFSVIFSAK